MVWKDSYKIGIDIVDKQHEELFAKVTEFLEALRKDVPWSEKEAKVRETMAFMQDYVVVHFTSEEEYQKSIQYPRYPEHHKIHEDFKSYVNQCASAFEKSSDEVLVQQFGGRLLAWLINHVVATDHDMAVYVSKKGGSIR